MSGNAKLFEQYKKSDIFNLNDEEYCSMTERKPRTRNVQEPLKNTQNDLFNILEPEQSPNVQNVNQLRKNKIREHNKSDIFNFKDVLQTPKKPTVAKNRNASNISNCFESMKDNEGYKTEIKDYTSKHRAEKKKYNPDKYFIKEDPSGRLYNQFYDNKRNPILPNKNSNMMKSSANLFPNINLNDKKLFTEKKKKMTRQFTNAYLNNENLTERKKLTEENIKGINNHKFYKNKGFTYKENNYLTENKYAQPNQYPGNSSKITRQMQLQSNIFGENDKNNKVDEINTIKERIKAAQENDEERPKKTFIKTNNNRNKAIESEDNDRNIWGALHNNWEKSNLNWDNSNTEIMFSKTFSGRFPKKIKEKENEDAFQRKIKQLSDSGFKDTINESIKSKRWKKVPHRELTYTNLEQIDEVLNEIPDNILLPNKKKKILGNAITTDFNGNTVLEDKYKNYKKYHKNYLNKNEKKNNTPTIKIMSNEENKIKKNINNNKKTLNKTITSLKMHDDYNIHDYILSYESKAKSSKTNFDNLSQKDMKLLFSKKGIHIYDIQKNHFDNGKYNTIKFKIRENEGEQLMKEKMKEVENDLAKKQYKVFIEKEKEKDKKKNLRGIAKNPLSKGLIIAEDENNKENKLKKKEPHQLRKNASFSGMFTLINHNYKKNK